MDSVINALETALAANPDDEALRLNLAQACQKAERFDEGLDHFRRILETDPVHGEALSGAAACADKLGNEKIAAGYRSLLTALQGPAVTDQTSLPNEPTTPTPAAEEVPARPEKEKSALRLVTSDGSSVVESEEAGITLQDIGGMEDVKRRIELQFLAPLRNPELMKAYGKSLGGGLLLYGPPGCGKTYIARALAGELGARFFSVGLSDVLDMYVGESERKLHDIMDTARRHTPAVLFFDEIDALGQKRAHLRHSGTRNTVNQLLTEMDSVKDNNDGLFILGATNHPWDVDTALRRPGRFDRMIAVFPPDAPAREAILKLHLRGKPVSEAVSPADLARQTEHFSGADLRYLVEQATEKALEESLQSGAVRPLQPADFSASIQDIRPSTRAWFENAKNYALFANEGGAFDDLVDYLRARNWL